MKPLSVRHQMFADEILKGTSQTAAYKMFYTPKNDNVAAAKSSQLVRNGKIAAYIEEKRKEMAEAEIVTREQLLKQYARIGFGDVRKLFNGNGLMRDVKDVDDDTAAAIAGVDIDESFGGRGEERELSGYTKKIKMWDKVRALDSIRDMLGWTKGLGSQENPLQVKIIKDTI